MEHKLRLNQPAFNLNTPTFDWDAGFPVGNGRLGAMVRGLLCGEVITLNEDSLWYGPHADRGNPDGKAHIEEIRSLLKQGKVREADKMCYMALTSVPKYFGAFEPMGELYIYFNHSDKITEYQRELDLANALANVSYQVDGMQVRRECFASYPDQVMVFRLSADKPELDVHFNIMRRPCDLGTEVVQSDILHMPGQCGPDGVRFSCLLGAQSDGEMTQLGDFIGVKNASEIVIYIAANSDFYEEKPFDVSLNQLKAAMALGYDEVKRRHLEDYCSLYQRAEIDFGTENKEPIDCRLEKLRTGQEDAGLLELIFHYGRYLMISASRPGSQAMNLQGVWNDKFAARWECNYTININTEMNYWIAETTQLSECHEPLFTLIDRMVPNGEKTARELYGCGGFVAHHATNLWGDTAIEGISFPSSVWPMGGAWFCLHMWDHYCYTLDKGFLEKRAFPVMKSAAEFFTQYLTEAEDGCFVTGPSLSPENVYLMEDGTPGRECMAPEMDNQILRALFRAVTRACEILDCCDSDYEKFMFYLSKIRTTRINHFGGIMEWDRDYKEAVPGHRHLSPLFGLYPDDQISVEKTPELAEACAKTLERRLGSTDMQSCGDGYFGWSGAWAAACFARLGNAEMARECLEVVLRESMSDSLLNNLPIFQIEGNFGVAAAVYELMLRSDEEKIVLLPALPKIVSKAGSFRGLAARGGFIIDAQWKDGKAVRARILSKAGGICQIQAEGIRGVNAEYRLENGILSFRTEKNGKYELYF